MHCSGSVSNSCLGCSSLAERHIVKFIRDGLHLSTGFEKVPAQKQPELTTYIVITKDRLKP